MILHAAALALTFIVLHRVDGGAVSVSPHHITALTETAISRGRANTLVHSESQCVVSLSDRRIFAVRESCATIQNLIEGSKQP